MRHLGFWVERGRQDLILNYLLGLLKKFEVIEKLTCTEVTYPSDLPIEVSMSVRD